MQIYNDLDSTLNRLQDRWLWTIWQRLGETIALTDVTTWDRLADAKYQDLLKEPEFFLWLGVEPGSQQMLQMLQADGHELWVITIAHENSELIKDDKRRWLRKYFPFISTDDIIFDGDKAQYAKPGYVLIDDGPHNITAWRAAGGTGIIYDQPWNRHLDGYRIKAWHELALLLKRIEAAA